VKADGEKEPEQKTDETKTAKPEATEPSKDAKTSGGKPSDAEAAKSESGSGVTGGKVWRRVSWFYNRKSCVFKKSLQPLDRNQRASRPLFAKCATPRLNRD